MSKTIKLKQLADENGIFKILALDHVSTLRNGLTKMTGIDNINDLDLLRIKKAVIKALEAEISGILLDPDTYYVCQDDFTSSIGTLIKFENGWVNGARTRERVTSVNETWTLERIASTKALGIKLMLYYRPDASKDTIGKQKELVRKIGKECKKLDIIFCLEPMWYPLLDDEVDPGLGTARILAQRRPMLVIDSLRDFARPEYHVDLFKLEFPADLNFVKEYVKHGDNTINPLYDLSFVKDLCREMGAIVTVPWTVMSSGVSNPVFIKYIHLCKEGCVSGYICGQAIWKDALRTYPNFQAINDGLNQGAVLNIRRINKAMNS